jgi:hypothetical protein
VLGVAKFDSVEGRTMMPTFMRGSRMCVIQLGEQIWSLSRFRQVLLLIFLGIRNLVAHQDQRVAD